MSELEANSPVLRRLIELCPNAVERTDERRGEDSARVRARQLESAMRALRDDEALDFKMLIDLTAVDWLDREPRFDVVYQLYSPEKKQRIRISVGVSESACELDSLVSVWPAANWLEREVWDLYGIRFEHHPDLRRILLYEEFEGHPLRKDYPKRRRQPLIDGAGGD